MTNILRPNFFGIQTASTPEWMASTGMVAKVTDATGAQSIAVGQGGKLDLDGALGANLIVLHSLASSQVSLFRSGGEIRFKLLSTGETFLSLPSTTAVQTLRFTDGDKSLQIVSGLPKLGSSDVPAETVAPTLLSAGVVGSELQLNFSEEISGGNLPLASAFQIAVDSAVLGSTQYAVVGAEGNTLRISLPASAASAATVSVSYVDPTTADDTRAVQDVNGNDLATFGPLVAVRNPADVRAPVLLAAATSLDGSKITLQFNEDVAGSAAASRFAVSVGGVSVGVSASTAQGKVVELSLATGAVASGQAVQLAYSGSSGTADKLRDTASNAVADWTGWSVSNEVLGPVPVLAKATNLLRPNFYGIETALTPNWKVSAGMVAKVTDASGSQMITVARGGKLDLDGAIGSNIIVLEGRISSEVEVYRSGTEVRFRLLETGETILSMPATSTAQTVRFVNGDKVLQIVSGMPLFDGVQISVDTTAPVLERATISGTELRLVFSEEIHATKLPAASTLTITVNGQVLTSAQFTIQGAEGKQLVIGLAQAAAEGAAVTVAYADPTAGDNDLAIQDINGNDAASFGPIQAVEPVSKIFLDNQSPAGSPGNSVQLAAASKAFHFVEDFSRTSNFEITGFGADDKLELTNLPTPGALSISTEGSDVSLIVNADGGITSQLLLKGVVPQGVLVYNPATFNDLAVGDLVGIDAARPVFTGGSSRVVGAVEGQANLVTVTATDASGSSYKLQGGDSALLQVSAGGVVSLKDGVLDFDAATAKRTYAFNVIASDAFGNEGIQALTVNVTNDPADDVPGAVTIQSLNASSTVSEGASVTYTVTLSGAAPSGGFVVDWQAVPATTGDPAEAQDFGTGASSAFPTGSITIAAGQTTGQIVLPVFDDTLAEGQENFVLQVGKLTAGNFTSAAQWFTTITSSDQSPGGDTTPPTLTITAPSLTTGQKVLANGYVSVNFTFSEAVTGFDASDVVVTNGVLNSFLKSTETLYTAWFQPNGGVDGTATVSVAAGRFTDTASNASTAAASLSMTLSTVQPGNSGGTEFTVPATGTSVINVRFSEPIFEKTAGASISGFSLALNPSDTNGFQGTGTAPLITGFTLGEGSAADGYKLVTLQTNTTFASGDVVRVSISGYGGNFRDADGNGLAAQDIHIGGSGANTIDLGDNWFSSRQILRGNGGNDTLTGTDNADSLIDGGGADFIDPVWGGDSIALVENGSSIAYARDTISIGFGDSRRGVGNTDFIGFDVSNSASGFDWFSSNSAAHDVLQLESGAIGTASSFAAAPATQGVITGHTISGGIVSFQGSSGAVTIRQDNTSLGNALDYLRFNLQAAGHTVAFKADYDNNGVAESLFVYQDVGTLPLAGNAEMPDIVVRIAQPGDTAAARLASVTLGNTAGANVLEIQDGFSPEPAMVGLTANGVQLNFVEPMFAPATASALGMSLKVNGTGTAYTPATVTGAGTSVITVQANGLAMGATDWALVTYSGSSSANALRDAAGKLLVPTDDNGNPSSATFALGSSGNNTIDLSGYAVTGWGLDIEAGAGDDLVTGTASHDFIVGGTGADTLRGGAGDDSFGFEQGDSPVLTLNTSVATDAYMLTGATYTFAGGKAEVIESLAVGDQVWLNPPFEGVTGSPWLSMMGGTSSPGNNGLVTNQGYFGVRGTLGANGVFTVGTYNNSPDTLVVYDGDGSSGVSQTGFVLKGVPMGDLEGLMYGSQPIRLRAPTAVNGTAGNDTLNGTYAADVINGLGGDDYLNGNEGNDTLDGGSGNDIAGYWSTWQSTPLNFTSTWRTSGGLQADGLGGTDTLINIEELHFGGGMGNDTLVGDTGRNYIEGASGNDTMTGGGGNDTFGYSPGQRAQGDDTVTDFSGDDQLWFNGLNITSLTAGANAGSLMAGEASIVVGSGQTTLHVGTDSTAGADLSITLTGSFLASGFSRNLITFGSVVNTEIRYASGEFFVGTSGPDSRNGGEGNDTLEGREGNDSLTGMAGNDILRGEAGNDQLRGEDGNDTLEGGDGNDYMTGGLGNDSLVGGVGSDTADYYFLGNPTGSLGPVTVNLTTGLATGGQGNDTLSGIENVNGTDGNDVITGDVNANRLEGRGGDDILNGGLGADRFILGQDAGSDTIDGGGYITRTPWPAGLTVPNNGDDYDRLVYSNAASGINLNMTTRTVTVAGLAGTDTYTNIEEVQGTTKTDTVVGKPSDGSSSFFFWGLGGSDVITQDTYGVGGRWTDGLQVGYSWSETGLTVNWTGNQATVAYGAGNGGTLNGNSGAYAAGTDTLTNILYIQTSNYNDVVNGEGATLNHLGYLTNPFGETSYFIVAVRGGNDVVEGSGNFLLIPEVNTIAAAAPANGVGITVDGRAPGADGLLLMDMTHLKAPVSETTAHGTVKFSGVSYVFGTPWADTVHAGNGIYDFRGQGGNDTFHGDENNNLSSYRSSNNGVSVNLAQGVVADLPGGTSSGTDTLRGVEMIEGTRFNDVFDAQGFSELSVNAGGTASIWKGMTNWYTPMGGNDTVTGNGYTRLGFTSAMMGIDANLAEGYVDSLATDAATRASPEYLYTVGRTTFTGVNGVGGTDYADRLVGSNGGGAIGTTLAEGFDPRGGADTVDGQGGFDTVFYSSAPNAIQVNMTLATGQVVQDGWDSSDTLVNIERVEGSHWNDTFLGNDGDNSFRGLSGADTIDGGNGQDQVDYWSPRMSGSEGVIVDLGGTAVRSAAVFAATPEQLPAGFTGWARDNWGDIDLLKSIEGIGGSDWDDVLIGSDGNNRIHGWAGSDTIDGAGGIDWAEYLTAEAGVTANLALGQTQKDGSLYADTLINIENLRGSVFNDSLVGDAGANQFKGEAGNDTINGGGGIDLATYVGARADYNAVFANGILTLTDNVAGRDGVDTVSEVERFDFAGVFYALNGLGQLVLEPAPT